MKFYLIIAVFSIFLIIGIIIYYRYYLRHKLYSDLLYICKYLKNNISFKKDNLNEILSIATSNMSFATKHLIKNKNANYILFKKCDIEMVDKFLQSLGKGDVEYEINNINYYSTEFEEMKNLSKENLQKNGVVYLKVIIGLGLCVCIMLL